MTSLPWFGAGAASTLTADDPAACLVEVACFLLLLVSFSSSRLANPAAAPMLVPPPPQNSELSPAHGVSQYAAATEMKKRPLAREYGARRARAASTWFASGKTVLFVAVLFEETSPGPMLPQ